MEEDSKACVKINIKFHLVYGKENDRHGSFHNDVILSQSSWCKESHLISL